MMHERDLVQQTETELLEPEIIGDVDETAIDVLKSGRSTLHGEIAVTAYEDAPHDREYMLILDEENSSLKKPRDHFLSQRLLAKMALIGAVINPDGSVTFSVPDEKEGLKSVSVTKSLEGEKRVAILHDEPVHAVVQDSKASELFSGFLKHKVALVARDPDFIRYADPKKYGSNVILRGFVDGAPYSIGVKTSLASLVASLPTGAQPDMLALRPNVSIKGKPDLTPYDEDTWSRIQIGNVIYKVDSAGIRCAIPDVNQHTGMRTNQTNKALREAGRDGIRTIDGSTGVFFAVNATPLTSGVIRPGDQVKLLARNSIPHWRPK
ncbi:MOSC domain-containing protein [Candidatus Gottesmanbacteria bacterium]|nr:MOSC domain-containing protein [Candidatus Gottesmanbacteria bacterium]